MIALEPMYSMYPLQALQQIASMCSHAIRMCTIDIRFAKYNIRIAF